MRLKTFTALVIACASLSGCVTVEQAQNHCTAFGFTPGSLEHANCVQQQHQANRANFQQGMLNASRIMNSDTSRGFEPTYGGAASGTAFLRSNYVSGMNRICVYNRLGSQFVMTIGAAQMCPLSVP